MSAAEKHDKLNAAYERIRNLENDVSKLERKIEAREQSDNSRHLRMRDQLDSLAVAIESGRASIPQTPAQWQRCLQAIAKGGEWEHGTWR